MFSRECMALLSLCLLGKCPSLGVFYLHGVVLSVHGVLNIKYELVWSEFAWNDFHIHMERWHSLHGLHGCMHNFLHDGRSAYVDFSRWE